MSTPKLVRREDFVRHFQRDADLTYLQAERAYGALMRLFESSLAQRASIRLARVGTLAPVRLKARKVVCGFKWVNGQRVPARREFWLDERTGYVFRVHRAFANSQDLAVIRSPRRKA